MALICCPECKKEISDRAAACVHCGCPISAVAEQARPQVGVGSGDAVGGIWGGSVKPSSIWPATAHNAQTGECGYILDVDGEDIDLLAVVIDAVKPGKQTIGIFDDGCITSKLGELVGDQVATAIWSKHVAGVRGIYKDYMQGIKRLERHTFELKWFHKLESAPTGSSSGGMQCPKCQGHNIQIMASGINMKQQTVRNVNPLQPFTPYKHKQKKEIVLWQNSSRRHDWRCVGDCNRRYT